MATRYGYQVLQWLLERGWRPEPHGPEGAEPICGDRGVLNPRTGVRMNVYDAARLNREWTGEYPDFLPEGW